MGSIPPITKNLLIINVLCFFASIAFASHGIDFDELFGLHFFLASHFRPWQLFTYMFMHAGWQHLFFNMFAVWMFGRIMEQTMGQGRFLFYYLTCGLGAGLMQELVQVMQYWYLGYGSFEQVSLGGTLVPMADYLNRWNTVGASGAVYGILLAFGMTYPEERMFIFPLPVPIKAKYFVMGYAVIELLSALSYGNGNSSWDGLRRWFSSLTKKKEPHIDVTYGGRYGQEAAYRQQKKEEEEELNRILDKVKKSGYDGLTPEEKRRLFDITKPHS